MKINNFDVLGENMFKKSVESLKTLILKKNKTKEKLKSNYSSINKFCEIFVFFFTQ